MVNKQLISIRLDADVLNKIDELTKKHSYWKRSTIINHLLSVLLRCANEKVLFRMMKTSYFFEFGYEIQFEINKQKISERNQPTYDE